MNKTPYMYDDLWIKHEMEYLKYYGYEFISNLTIDNSNIKSPMILLKYDGKYVLRGYCDGIVYPLFKQMNMTNINGNRIKICKRAYTEIFDLCKKYDVVDTKIYQYPYYSFVLNHDILSLSGFKSDVQMCTGVSNLLDYNFKPNVGRVIKKYVSSETFYGKVCVHFGEIDNDVYDMFIKKHLLLSGKKTKPDTCWEILKQFVLQKKAIIVQCENDFVYFFCSENFSYYGINACTKKSDICVILIYEALLWLAKNDFNFVYMGKYISDDDKSKEYGMSYFKKTMSNVIFNNYVTQVET
jgi:hypothetical protein